jgi:predicted membrane protein
MQKGIFSSDGKISSQNFLHSSGKYSHLSIFYWLPCSFGVSLHHQILKFTEMEKNKQHSSCSGKRTNLFFGLLLILAGTLFLAFNLGWLDSSFRQVVFSWQIIFVILTIFSLINRNYFSAFIFLAFTTFFFLPKVAEVYPESLPWIDSGFAKNFWPLLIIFIGISIIFGIFSKRKRGKFVFFLKKDKDFNFNTVEGPDGVYHRNVIFGGAEDVFLEPVFRGGEIEVVFGGVELDLRRTMLPEGDTHLKISAVFGGVELHLPDNWKVIHKIDAIFGGVDKKRSQAVEIDNSRRLIITGEVIFGGCDIR